MWRIADDIGDLLGSLTPHGRILLDSKEFLQIVKIDSQMIHQVAGESEGDLVEVDWQGLRVAYEARDGTEAELRARFGVSEGQLRYRREKENWVKRSARKIERGTLIAKMMRVLALQLSILEKQMKEPIDKEATLLGTMAKTMEKLMELEKADAAQRPAQKDLTELRRKVAKRIEQLTRRNDVG